MGWSKNVLWSQIIPNWLLDSGNTLSVQVAQELRQGLSCKLKWIGGWQTLSPGSGDRMSTWCVSRRHCKPDLKMQCLGTRCELSSLSWSYGMWLLYGGKLSGGDTGVAFSWFRWSSAQSEGPVRPCWVDEQSNTVREEAALEPCSRPQASALSSCFPTSL